MFFDCKAQFAKRTYARSHFVRKTSPMENAGFPSLEVNCSGFAKKSRKREFEKPCISPTAFITEGISAGILDLGTQKARRSGPIIAMSLIRWNQDDRVSRRTGS